MTTDKTYDARSKISLVLEAVERELLPNQTAGAKLYKEQVIEILQKNDRLLAERRMEVEATKANRPQEPKPRTYSSGATGPFELARIKAARKLAKRAKHARKLARKRFAGASGIRPGTLANCASQAKR